MTPLAPESRRNWAFAVSRAADTIVASGASRRTSIVTKTLVASWSVAMTTCLARVIPASLSTCSRRASPTTAVSPASDASRALSSSNTTTTTSWRFTVPEAKRPATALRPFTPYPMTTVCADTLSLHFRARHSEAVRRVKNSMVVPTSTIRKMNRNGVMIRMFVNRAMLSIGTMSP